MDQMSPFRRELYLSIVDSQTDFHEITMRLHFLDDHFPTQKLDRALKWLIDNGFTGAKFTPWFKFVCKSSDLEMHRILLSIVDNLIKPGQLIAGQNFRI